LRFEDIRLLSFDDLPLLQFDDLPRFGARVVTGYLYNPFSDNGDTAAIGAGTTHAWAEIYLPGAGWTSYDPTNGTVNGGNLIRVAVTRDISQAVPVGGSFVGARGDYLGMTVDVAVISERRAEALSA
jgi:transglutaminase-like putative cysteine protease